MNDIIDTSVLDYEEPQPPPITPATSIDNIFGNFPQVTTTPTWTPRFFKDAIAFKTGSSTIYYYDFADATWRSSGGTNGFEVKVFDDTTTVSTGDGKLVICIPEHMNGLNLTSAHAFCSTSSGSGTPTIQIRNVTQTADMLSTRITIDVGEYTSYTAATPPVIDTANDDVATGDLIAIDVDVAGNTTKGLGVILIFS